MPREPLRLTKDTLAVYRPGALVAVAMGALAGVPQTLPRPYLVGGPGYARAYQASAELASAGRPGQQLPAATAILPIRGVLTQYATISDCGELCSYDRIEADALELFADPGVGRVILDIDSNGGDVPGLEDAAARVRAAALASGKLLLGYTPGSALSAAYWFLAATCEGIYLSRSGRLGAVGCVVAFGSSARKLAKEGVDIYVGRRPSGKFRPNDVEALDDLGKGRIDRLADEGAGRFVAAIAAARGLSPDVVEGWNADTFTGADAVGAGLADGTGRLEEIIALAETWPRWEAA